jgi:ABC-type lipoprotein release transport system permease subunit
MIPRLALRNAARNVTRTTLTALTILLGVALLAVALSWMNGIFGMVLGTSAAQAGHVRVVQPDYAAREQLFPLYDNIPDSSKVVESLAKQPGVVAAYPRILTGVAVSSGGEIGDVFAIATGAPIAWYTDQLRLQDDLSAGAMLSGKDGEMVLGATVAKRAGAKVGDEIVLIGQTQDGAMSPIKAKVVGIVSTGTALIDQSAFLPLGPVQYLADVGDGATEILLYGASRDRASRLRDQIAALPETKGYAVEAWSERDPWAGIIVIATAVRLVLSTVIVFITALGVWNTMMMSVLERTGEIGVMRSMGLTAFGTVALFVIEALTIAGMGGIGGVILGGLGGSYLERYGVELGGDLTQNVDASLPFQTRLYADVTPQILLAALALGLLMAFIGSAAPAYRAASIQPVEAMRSRR